MEWQLGLLIVLGSLLILMATGLPVAFCFIIVNVLGVILFLGGVGGIRQFSISIFESITIFTLMPIPLFILMGEVMFRSGVFPAMLDAMDKWLGRLPGRLGLLGIGSGVMLATLTGDSFASVAMLGSVLTPEMEKRGYKKSMSIGPILGAGGLAFMIPPSTLAVVLGAIARISIGKILIAIIVPGLLLASLYIAYIIIRSRLQPSIAPDYEVAYVPLSGKLIGTVRYILPVGLVIFLVIGLIILGVATPSEAAATGAIGTFILAALYKKLNWEVVKQSIRGSVMITIMVFMIIIGAATFGQLLTYIGASRGLIQVAIGLPVAPIFVFLLMQLIVLIMGTFMELISIMMVTLPLFMPVVQTLGFNPVWFAVVFLLNGEMACITPPFGMNLFVMKGVAPRDTTMGDIIRAGLPFLGLELIAMVLVIAFPIIALWLPGLIG